MNCIYNTDELITRISGDMHHAHLNRGQQLSEQIDVMAIRLGGAAAQALSFRLTTWTFGTAAPRHRSTTQPVDEACSRAMR